MGNQLPNSEENRDDEYDLNCDPVDFFPIDLVETSHDIIAGASGGPLLVPNKFSFEGNPIIKSMLVTGVLQGVRVDESVVAEVWGPPVESETPTTEAATLVTAVKPEDVVVIERDIVWDPAAPDRPLLIGNPPVCLEEDGQGGCAEWETTEPFRNTKRDEGRPVRDFGLPEPNGSFPSDEEVTSRVGQGNRQIVCRHDASTLGVMVGLQGGLALAGASVERHPSDVLDRGGGIGSFLGVCAPFSATSYTNNWRHLVVRGAQVERHLDTLGGQWGWGTFDEYMSRVYEERSYEDADGLHSYVRPPSAKLCPPNYLLQGVGLAKSSADATWYSGVTTLRCVLPRSVRESRPELNPFVTVYPSQQLTATKSGTAPDEFVYKINDHEFDMTQMLGYPECVGGCMGFVCKNNDVMIGFKTAHDDQGRLTYFEPICAESP